MPEVSIATLVILFLPFLVSLAGQGTQVKMITFITGIMALLLSVEEYGAVLPWVIGTIIALVALWERIREHRMV